MRVLDSQLRAQSFEANVAICEVLIERSHRVDVDRQAELREQLVGLVERSMSIPWRLGTAFELNDLEELVLWLLITFALRSDLRRLISPVGITSDSLIALLAGERPSVDVLAIFSDHGRLRRLSLIERTDTRDVPRTEWTWSVPLSVLQWASGSSNAEIPVWQSEACELPEHLCLDVKAIDDLKHTLMQRRSVFVVIQGSAGSGRRTHALVAARECDLELVDVHCEALASDEVILAKQLSEIARESRMRGAAPLLHHLDSIDARRLQIIGERLLPIISTVLATAGRDRPKIPSSRSIVTVELRDPPSSERAQLWRRSLGLGSQSDAEHLASQYPLASAMIVRASRAAKARLNDTHHSLSEDDVYAGIRSVLDAELGQFARRLSVTQTWRDIVLTRDQISSARELIARVRQRSKVYEDWGFARKLGKGLGLAALFSGPPGTGKTMIASLIAKELKLEIYQIDLSKIVSKWIGETEKNLAAVFDAAESGHAILLFDEADSLFGKRTDVKSSNDRHANLETNFLLQRMESFTGVVLLTSNHDSNMDPAFRRRLSLHVRFELPEAAERELLWRAVLEGAPLDGGIDFESLAERYEMSGGYIRNAALRAAFVAADEDVTIGQVHLEQAALREYEGMGKLGYG